MYVWLEKSTLWDLRLKLFTNNLEDANQTLLQICPPKQITYPLIKQGRFIRESLQSVQRAVLFSTGHCSSNQHCSHTKIP